MSKGFVFEVAYINGLSEVTFPYDRPVKSGGESKAQEQRVGDTYLVPA